ncbi:MAG TPA: DUF3488 and transglutaminase-like domain-containing protein, partial [Pyrinomonadaceae bacterium]|nr:DUF3488 and transglutaminase-like domain-containing protein [Pyrinomonadaceae bacterium]
MAVGASNSMNFEKFFRLISYAVALCGLFSLFVSGGVGILVTFLFVCTVILAWFLEDTRWQISERIGIVLIFLAIPLFYLEWKYQFTGSTSRELFQAGSLARLILFLCAVKLLQKKSERDWIFVYLISFFEVLLAAGLSISPLYLASLVLFLLTTICAIVAFEMRKTSNDVSTRKNISNKNQSGILQKASLRKFPVTALTLLILITALAVPLFFAFPRVGGAGLGSSLTQGKKVTGFSDSVRLGEIANILQSDEIVMRVRLENGENIQNPRWRGVALDSFDGRTWSKSKQRNFQSVHESRKNLFVIEQTSDFEGLTIQTVYLEPIQTPVLFALSRPIRVQGNFSVINRDAEGSLLVTTTGLERTSYKVLSETVSPNVENLKKDNGSHSLFYERYLRTPENLDDRIVKLTQEITGNAGNRYDRAKAVEKYLQNNLGYTLNLKAGGEDPLADFLFNVREGHCEYFSTAMAIMLRTQGIATRVVNGFQSGEYNETAGVFVVKQKNAHSWVEVYFPQENAWIPFDPTPFAGQLNSAASTGVFGTFSKYLEALETFWIQYFVAYDNQEQRSLFNSVRSSFQDYQAQTSAWLNDFQETL